MTEPPVETRHGGALVLNTGRCGSTLLSDLLGEHPATASIQEFFITINRLSDAFRPGEVSGREFWEMINEPAALFRVLHRIGRLPKEFRYSAKNHPADTPLNVSGFLGHTLPALSDDPDGLLGELELAVDGFPSQTLRNHYLQLFALLTRHSGKKNWVERSGGSDFIAKDLVEMFPELPVIYLDRDCVDTAVSLSHFPVALLTQVGVEITEQVGVNPYAADAEYDPEALPAQVVPLLPENITAEALDARAGSFAFISRSIVLLALMRRMAEAALKEVPDGQLLRVRYEDLVRDPHECLGRIGDFLGLAACDEWVARVADQVRAQPPRQVVDDTQRKQLSDLFDALVNAPVGDGQQSAEELFAQISDIAGGARRTPPGE